MLRLARPLAETSLVALAHLRSKPDNLLLAERTVTAFASYLNSNPATMPRIVLAWSAIQ